MNTSLKIAFMGTPDFAVYALDALAERGHEIVCVYSQPPRPAGRGHKMQPSPVQHRAEELNIPVRTPMSFKKDADARQAFAALGIDVAVIAAYGLILPQEILDAPKYGCINIHASLLPRWRGAAPLQRALLAGDSETGICIMQMDAGLDTGDVLMRETVLIADTTTVLKLHDTLGVLGAEMIVKTLDLIADGKPPVPQKQSEDVATYATKMTREDGRIDWTQPASVIERQLRALIPWPGVWCLCNGDRLKVLEVSLSSLQGKPGQILDRHFTVACGEDALFLKKVQPKNRKPMDGVSFINGAHIKIGDMLD